MIDRMQTLTDSHLSRIHNAAMEILRDIGVSFESEKALVVFRNNAFTTNGNKVFFSEKQVQSALENVPSSFTLTARDPAKSITIGADGYALSPGYGAPFIIEADTGRRNATYADYNNFCKLVHTSSVLNTNGYLMVMPSDLPVKTAYLDMLYSNIVLCDKPFMGSPQSEQTVEHSLEMADIAWGDGLKKADNEKTVMAFLMNPVPPLKYPAEVCNSIITAAAFNQASIVSLLIMAGASGPITLPELLAQQTAEMLAGVVLTQFVRPGSPVIAGGSSSIMDMRTGALSMGAPEYSVISSATVQIADYYGIPARGGSSNTDSWRTDYQAGVESSFGLFTSLRNGAHFIMHSAGILGAYSAMSFEKFIADEELCRYALEVLKPVFPSGEQRKDRAVDFGMIKETGIGGNYLMHPVTIELCRNSFFESAVFTRQDYPDWKSTGARTIEEKADSVLLSRLESYRKPDIDPAVEKDLARFVQSRKNG